jgi:hypothetical protein
MSQRDKRLPRSGRFSRKLNEHIRGLQTAWGRDTIDAVCECTDETCFGWVEVAMNDYDRIRAIPHQFIVTPGHEVPGTEVVVERYDRYLLVREDATL